MTGLIVHEWIEANGGAEKVVAAMVDAFPDVDVLALWDDAPGTLGTDRVTESWLARTPLRRSKIASLPVLPFAWRRLLDAERPHDWVMASSHLFAHHVGMRGVNSGIPKLVYVHSPARYLWVPDLDPRGSSAPARAAASLLKPLDRHRAAEATALASNSRFVAKRVEMTWGRQAEVIHPPVEVTEIQAVADWSASLSGHDSDLMGMLPETFLLGASRMVPYKRLDLVIRAGEVSGVPVVLAGGGPDEARLRSLADTADIPVMFVGRPSTPLLRALFQRCAAFVFPPIEDFGIVPVEAMAAGAPVICNRIGGASESLTEAGVGEAINPDDDAELASAVSAVMDQGVRVPNEATLPFSRERFIREIQEFVARHTS